MSFNVYRYIEHDVTINNQSKTFRFELLKKDFTGDAVRMVGQENAFRHTYQKINPKKPLEEPIQKSFIEVDFAIQDDTDFSIMQEIEQSDEGQYRLRKKVDGAVKWTGPVLNDMSDYPEKPYPFPGTVKAKDLSKLESDDYVDSNGDLIDVREKVITTIADILGRLNLGLDIHTYTSWVNENMTDTDDYLNQTYHDTLALRQFARSGDESDQAIRLWDALQRICRTHGLLIRQAEGAWKIYQITELDDPTSVHEFVYDSNGVQQSVNASKDITVEASDALRHVLPSSKSKNTPGLVEIRNKYDHRTEVSGLQFPAEVVLDANNQGPESFSRFFISDGNQEIDFSAEVNARWDSGVTQADVDWRVKVGDYWYDATAGELGASGNQITNTTELTILDETSSFVDSTAMININIANIPADADGTIEVVLFRAQGDSTNQETRWRRLSLDIVNPTAQENSQSIDYVTRQSGDFSGTLKLPVTWYGDGPVGYSPGALRYSTNDDDFTAEDWQRRGDTADGYRNVHENLHAEFLDSRRSLRKRLAAQLYGSYQPEEVLHYRSKYFFFLGGTQTSKNYRWTNAEFFEINIQKGSSTFTILKIFKDETNSGSASSQSSPSNEGITREEADVRYIEESEVPAAELKQLTAAEASQLLNIGSVTITNTQWGYVGAMDQSVATDQDVTFQSVAANQADPVSGDMTTIAYGFASTGYGIGFNSVDNRVFYNLGAGTPFWVEPNKAKFNVELEGALASFSSLTVGGSSVATESWVSSNFDNYQQWEIGYGVDGDRRNAGSNQTIDFIGSTDIDVVGVWSGDPWEIQISFANDTGYTTYSSSDFDSDFSGSLIGGLSNVNNSTLGLAEGQMMYYDGNNNEWRNIDSAALFFDDGTQTLKMSGTASGNTLATRNWVNNNVSGGNMDRWTIATATDSRDVTDTDTVRFVGGSNISVAFSSTVEPYEIEITYTGSGGGLSASADETITGSWTFESNVNASGCGFVSKNSVGQWFEAHVTDDSVSSIFRGKDSGGNNIGFIQAENFDGAGGGYLNLEGDWRAGQVFQATDFEGGSDRRIKEDIRPITGALSTLRKTGAYTFQKNGEPSAGYIADELMSITSNVVKVSEFKEYKDFKSMGVFGMQAYNSAAIKELDQNVMSLEEKVEHLEQQVKELGGEPYGSA